MTRELLDVSADVDSMMQHAMSVHSTAKWSDRNQQAFNCLKAFAQDKLEKWRNILWGNQQFVLFLYE